MIYALVAVCLFGGTFAAIKNVTCPVLAPVENFNMTAFMGKWYRIVSTDRYVGECYTRSFRWGNPGEIEISVYARSQTLRSPRECTTKDGNNTGVDETWRIVRGWLECVLVTDFTVKFNESDQQELARRIIATDYDSYAVETSCVDSNWSLDVWTRGKFYDSEIFEKIDELIEKMNIKDFSYSQETSVTEHFDCEPIGMTERQRERWLTSQL